MGRVFGTILIWLWSSTVTGYPTPVDFDGEILRWNIDETSDPITFEIIGNESAVLSYGFAIAEAAAKWSDVDTSYFRYTPVTFGETADVTIKLKDSISGGQFSAGFATFDEKNDAGEVVHCTIEILVGPTVGLISFSKTILHELGHCLGLGHSLVPESIMSYALDQNSFDLDLDDIAAISRLYPADGSDPTLPPGCSLGATTGGQPVLLLLLPLLVLFFRRE